MPYSFCKFSLSPFVFMTIISVKQVVKIVKKLLKLLKNFHLTFSLAVMNGNNQNIQDNAKKHNPRCATVYFYRNIMRNGLI